MTEIDARTGAPIPSSGWVALTHLIYALHAFSAVTGLASAALVMTAFLSGWPSIIAVILNYVKRRYVRGTFLESHFRWQIRTFWFALLWAVVAGILYLTFILIPIALTLAAIVGLWVLYRIVRGWLALANARPMPMPA